MLGGAEQLAHYRLSYSRQMFVIAYPRVTQEMVLDAHNQAFPFFGGVPKRMVYDNLKTVIDAIFVGKERRFNRRFLTLAHHYLFEPAAYLPESAGKKARWKIRWVIFGNGYSRRCLTVLTLPSLMPGWRGVAWN